MSAQARGRRWWRRPVLHQLLGAVGLILVVALVGAGFLSGAGYHLPWPLASEMEGPDRSGSATGALPAPQAVAPEYFVYFPFVEQAPTPTPLPAACPLVPGGSYDSMNPSPPPTDRPAERHPDLNLAIRGWEATTGVRGFVVYDGLPDPNAPQLASLFADNRVPAFSGLYQVHDWDWACNCLGVPVSFPPVTILGMATTPGEAIRLPSAGYDIGSGYQALVLYAAPNWLTLKYTRDDNVLRGYTVHIEGICVDPGLLSLYSSLNASGRSRLPALKSGQVLGRAQGTEIRVSIRDAGSFMDPRSHDDWWQGR